MYRNKESRKGEAHKYEDIIHLPHPDSAKHPRMAVADRAAQFLPFAALTGYDAAVKETARLTEERMELDEDEKMALDRSMQFIQNHLGEEIEVTITYFQPDERKAGGAYRTVTGKIKKMDQYERCMVLQDGLKIRFDSVVDIERICLEE